MQGIVLHPALNLWGVVLVVRPPGVAVLVPCAEEAAEQVVHLTLHRMQMAEGGVPRSKFTSCPHRQDLLREKFVSNAHELEINIDWLVSRGPTREEGRSFCPLPFTSCSLMLPFCRHLPFFVGCGIINRPSQENLAAFFFARSAVSSVQ